MFGRAAMGERLRAAQLHDHIEVRRDGLPLYLDRARMEGDIEALLARGAVGRGDAIGELARPVAAIDGLGGCAASQNVVLRS